MTVKELDPEWLIKKYAGIPLTKAEEKLYA
jgi:hypothetical protein